MLKWKLEDMEEDSEDDSSSWLNTHIYYSILKK